MRNCVFAAIGFFTFPCGITLIWAQGLLPGPAGSRPIPPVSSDFVEQASRNGSAPCLEPPPLPGFQDYEGPMKKPVALIGRALERNSVPTPHYKAGAPLCALGVRDKFRLFLHNSIDPLTFLAAGTDAAIDQASDRDRRFGQGGAGYAKRFSAEYIDRLSGRFFNNFAYPSLFGEDPRYYRLGNGPVNRRLLHAVEHLFVAHHSDGSRMFNYSRWLGAASTTALAPLYHPGDERGAGAVAQNVGYTFAWDIGADVLKEFWPDIARKFKLPLRGAAAPSTQAATASANSGIQH